MGAADLQDPSPLRTAAAGKVTAAVLRRDALPARAGRRLRPDRIGRRVVREHPVHAGRSADGVAANHGRCPQRDRACRPGDCRSHRSKLQRVLRSGYGSGVEEAVDRFGAVGRRSDLRRRAGPIHPLTQTAWDPTPTSKRSYARRSKTRSGCSGMRQSAKARRESDNGAHHSDTTRLSEPCMPTRQTMATAAAARRVPAAR